MPEVGRHHSVDPKAEIEIHRRLAKAKGRRFVKILDDFILDGAVFIVMEYCEEGSLEDFVIRNRGAPMEILLATDVLLQHVDALKLMHTNKIMHRDLTAGNVLIKEISHGQDGVVKTAPCESHRLWVVQARCSRPTTYYAWHTGFHGTIFMLKMARSDDNWMCCYGCHVTEGAYKMAWIFTIVNIFGGLIIVLSFISTGLNAKIIFYSVTTLVSLLCWIPILCGHICGKRSHRMYLPFLVLFAISTVYAFFAILFLLQRILMFKSPDSIYVMFGLSLQEYDNIIVESSTVGLAFFTLYMIVIFGFWCWVYSIVFRAYKFTKQIGGDGTSNETKMPDGKMAKY
uniref:Protein kinase domain-containing protein n=1 Tax=Globodera rostochiensis TaxID=31243 RepID=A0A914HJV9_GLORO